MARTITRKLTTSASDTSAVKLAILADKAARVFVCRVAGIATGTKTNIHPQYGESIGLVGQFRRVNPDSTTQDAPVLWGTDTLIGPVASALENGAQSVQVLADVYAIHSDRGTMGFQYVLEVHGDVNADPIAQMLGTVPVLPAPALPTTEPALPTTEPAPAPAPAASTKKKG